MNGILNLRIRFDALLFEEQQSLIADGKSRFCAGGKFEKQRFDFYNRLPIPLKYGGAKNSWRHRPSIFQRTGVVAVMKIHGSCIPRSISQGFWLTKWRPPTTGLLRIRGLCFISNRSPGRPESVRTFWEMPSGYCFVNSQLRWTSS